jgi:hypothetical protein
MSNLITLHLKLGLWEVRKLSIMFALDCVYLTFALTDVTGNATLSNNDNLYAADRSDFSVSSDTQWLTFDESTGWIVAQSTVRGHEQNITRLCWLPVEFRGRRFVGHKSIFVIASDEKYQLTIIDFEPMLTMLRHLGVIV